MSVLRVLRDFLLDLIIGDDPKIAVAAVASLAVTAVLFVTGAVTGSAVAVVGAVIVVAAFTLSVFVDTRPPRP